MISLRLEDDLVARLEKYADKQGISRSMAIRVLLAAGLGDSAKASAARETLEIRRRFIAKLNELAASAVDEASE